MISFYDTNLNQVTLSPAKDPIMEKTVMGAIESALKRIGKHRLTHYTRRGAELTPGSKYAVGRLASAGDVARALLVYAGIDPVVRPGGDEQYRHGQHVRLDHFWRCLFQIVKTMQDKDWTDFIKNIEDFRQSYYDKVNVAAAGKVSPDTPIDQAAPAEQSDSQSDAGGKSKKPSPFPLIFGRLKEVEGKLDTVIEHAVWLEEQVAGALEMRPIEASSHHMVSEVSRGQAASMREGIEILTAHQGTPFQVYSGISKRSGNPITVIVGPEAGRSFIISNAA
ncbi:hypothetical protein [Chromobacterium phragmitis]|uniref:Uncharacterized protein n=1 Tax=Chromobacterium phragmitis TaxID=2202141 RepID=A0ABV0J0Y1_9NEIS